MNRRIVWTATAAVGFLLVPVSLSFAAGSHGGTHQGSHNAVQSRFAGAGAGIPAFANSWPYLRAENGTFGPVWAAPGPGTFAYGGAGRGGLACAGYGGGWGWGYGLTDYGYYSPDRLPYFNLYPPVYYSYSDGAIAPRSTLQSSWSGNAAAPRVAEAPPVAPSNSPPLRIANPYYSEK